jgi:hypothetical protein
LIFFHSVPRLYVCDVLRYLADGILANGWPSLETN